MVATRSQQEVQMGLDQYGYINAEVVKTKGEDGHTYNEVKCEREFYWRKHSRLQDFMEELFVSKTGRPAIELNCYDMELTMADMNKLEGAWHNAYAENVSEGGFFYGHQMQAEQTKAYREEDLEFIYAAREALAEGQSVMYSCWW